MLGGASPPVRGTEGVRDDARVVCPLVAGGAEEPAGAGASRASEDAASADTDLDELNDEGVGGTVGSKDTFEPEESDASRHPGGDSPQA